ncbi:MAG: tetratricopeptide repeat protein, partial [Acidobacteriota bacterium]|nr:tetratricopeptide repeat protein [Acidobacteriota bacterium]
MMRGCTTLTVVLLVMMTGSATTAGGGVETAETAFAAGDYRSAYRDAAAAIERDPDDVRARLIAGLAGLRLLDDRPRVSLDEVEGHFRKVLDLAPETAGIHYLLGFTLFQEAELLPNRRKYEAPALYEEAAERFSDELKRPTENRANASRGLAMSLTRLDRVDEALDAHDAWIAAQPDEPGAYVSAIKLAVAGARPEKSIDLLDRASKEIDTELPGLFELGLQCAGEENMTRVIDTIGEIVEAEWAKNALAILSSNVSDRPDLAASALDRFLSSNPPESAKESLLMHFLAGLTQDRSRTTGDRGDHPRFGNPRRVEYVRPTYPIRARQGRIEATVVLVGIVRRDGTADFSLARSTRPRFGFEQAALEAANAWIFDPGTLDGEPVDSFYVMRMD